MRAIPIGAMYGALELAEQISLCGGLEAVQEKARKPYILRRGLKFNIPSGRSGTKLRRHRNLRP